jgi:hypothetical protein
MNFKINKFLTVHLVYVYLLNIITIIILIESLLKINIGIINICIKYNNSPNLWIFGLRLVVIIWGLKIRLIVRLCVDWV